MSNWPLTAAISSGLTRSPGLSALTLAPCSTSASTDARAPWRAAKCSAVRPPCVPISSLKLNERVTPATPRLAGAAAGARRGPRRAAHAGALGVLRVADRVLQRLFRRGDAGEIDQLRGARRVGAVREQLADDVGAIERGGEHQRGLAVGRFDGVGVGAAARAACGPRRRCRSAAASISGVAPVAVDRGRRWRRRRSARAIAAALPACAARCSAV